uniref:ARAD1C07128p n=1 Tax=Blastobotrys adeninivorans TaxID=409370 RepID=A0A060T5R5_BLAAD
MPGSSDLASRIGGAKTKRGSFGLRTADNGQRGEDKRLHRADSGYSANIAGQPSSSLQSRLDSSRSLIPSRSDINTRVSKLAPKSRKNDSLLRDRLAGQKSSDPGQLFDEFIRADRSRRIESIEPAGGKRDHTEPRNSVERNFERIRGASKRVVREKRIQARSTSGTSLYRDDPISTSPGPENQLKIRGAGKPWAVKISNLDRRTTQDDVFGTFRHLGLSEPLSLTVYPCHAEGQSNYSEANVIFRNLAEAERCVEELIKAKGDINGNRLEATIVPLESIAKERTVVPRKSSFQASVTNSNEDEVVYVKGRGFRKTNA